MHIRNHPPLEDLGVQENLDRIKHLAEIGLGESTIASIMGYPLAAWKKAKRLNPCIDDALQDGMHLGIEQVAKALYAAAIDPTGGLSAKRMYLQARDPDQWREVKTLSGDISVNQVGEVSENDVSMIKSILNSLDNNYPGKG